MCTFNSKGLYKFGYVFMVCRFYTFKPPKLVINSDSENIVFSSEHKSVL